MYLTDLLIKNSGPIESLKLKFEFHQDGRPKPTLIVGGNGCGKTNVLSIVADALIEIASRHYRDIMPHNGINRSFYRLLGAPTIRIGADYKLTAAKFFRKIVRSAFGLLLGQHRLTNFFMNLLSIPNLRTGAPRLLCERR